MGINRSSSASDFEFFSGTVVGPNVSNANPYVHWSWYHPTFSANAGYDCVLAWADLKWAAADP